MNSIVKSSAWIGLEIYVHGNVRPTSLPVRFRPFTIPIPFAVLHNPACTTFRLNN